MRAGCAGRQLVNVEGPFDSAKALCVRPVAWYSAMSLAISSGERGALERGGRSKAIFMGPNCPRFHATLKTPELGRLRISAHFSSCSGGRREQGHASGLSTV